jgi:hypothetical protein
MIEETRGLIYVASSWRNLLSAGVVKALRARGHQVYDFRNPAPGNDGFRWTEIDPDWKLWSPEEFRDALLSPVAEQGFGYDRAALDACAACVLVLPCGKSAHLEAGYAAGQGKPVFFLTLACTEPELMYKLGSGVLTSLDELFEATAFLLA